MKEVRDIYFLNVSYHKDISNSIGKLDENVNTID
jgi:hypothetical protein